MNPLGDPLNDVKTKLSDANEEYFIDFKLVPQRGIYCEVLLHTKGKIQLSLQVKKIRLIAV